MLKCVHISLAAMLCLFSTTTTSHAQQLDKIAAVIGRNSIILNSELEMGMAQAKQSNTEVTTCVALQQMILQKMLVEQAERDSVVVTPEEVEGTLENRVRYFISIYGSKEKLEQVSGKTIYQLKEDYRDNVRETMVADKMQGQILQNVKVTPAEVQAFYAKIPADSLPFFPATVEMGQIVIDPPVSPELDAYAREKLEAIRKNIVENNADFELQASLNSQDPGSRDNGGDLGVMGRKDLVPEFSAAAFKLQNGEISQIVKTKFGYHIIQMIRRQGDDAHLRHILIKPELTSGDFQKAIVKLDSVRAELIAGKITFPEAVGKYATDDLSKRTGGMIPDAQTGATQQEVDKLDPSLALMVSSMKPGEFSQPQIFDAGRGDKSCRIVYLKSMTEPHKANMKDDYGKIQEVALQQKKSKKMDEWIAEKAPSYYVKIDPEYASCEELQNWVNNK